MGEVPLVVSVRLSPPSSMPLVTVGVVAKLVFAAKRLPERSKMVPPETVGVTAPPSLLNVTLLMVLFPVKVKTPPPLIITLLVCAINPLKLLWTRLALLRITSPLIKTAPAVPYV